ncbi:MAG: amino acid ABC transporter permease [Proteobacteria bacterium]|nr:amino acid ABC transporter permease [Pseudomonadota bacterium]MBU2228420.1 amino acid ABC transporter permease [Pseudomonadota bacterium]MBU2261262.1 amino acid ABC transporter permease [Pseudomonadota bacterium]
MTESQKHSIQTTEGAPVIRIGALQWVKSNLFNGVFNSILTIVMLFFLYKVIPPFVKWAFIDSLWLSSAAQCRTVNGACWSIIPANIRFIIFGFYPHELHWRPFLAMIMLVSLLFYSKNRNHWNKYFGYLWLAGLFIMGLLMKGGLLGLTAVESDQWGGLPLTLMLSFFGMFAAYPLGVLLALGRRSKMPAIKTICILYIELIRGVPLISLLFMSSVLFPLFLPEGLTINKILRAQVAIILFTAAYIAEVVRGGLQAIMRGQYEAAESLGLNYVQKMRLVVLPQALKIVIPPSVGILISAFKDTSLVVIIALYDVLKTTKATLANPSWMGFSPEAYIFVALIYFLCCYSMSNYSRRLEKELHA